MLLASIITAFNIADSPFGNRDIFLSALIIAPLFGLIAVIFFRISMETIIVSILIFDALNALRPEGYLKKYKEKTNSNNIQVHTEKNIFNKRRRYFFCRE